MDLDPPSGSSQKKRQRPGRRAPRPRQRKSNPFQDEDNNSATAFGAIQSSNPNSAAPTSGDPFATNQNASGPAAWSASNSAGDPFAAFKPPVPSRDPFVTQPAGIQPGDPFAPPPSGVQGSGNQPWGSKGNQTIFGTTGNARPIVGQPRASDPFFRGGNGRQQPKSFSVAQEESFYVPEQRFSGAGAHTSASGSSGWDQAFYSSASGGGQASDRLPSGQSPFASNFGNENSPFNSMRSKAAPISSRSNDPFANPSQNISSVNNSFPFSESKQNAKEQKQQAAFPGSEEHSRSISHRKQNQSRNKQGPWKGLRKQNADSQQPGSAAVAPNSLQGHPMTSAKRPEVKSSQLFMKNVPPSLFSENALKNHFLVSAGALPVSTSLRENDLSGYRTAVISFKDSEEAARALKIARAFQSFELDMSYFAPRSKTSEKESSTNFRSASVRNSAGPTLPAAMQEMRDELLMQNVPDELFSQEALIAHFESFSPGSVESASVRERKTHAGLLKRTAIIKFRSVEEAEKALATANYSNGKPLHLQFRKVVSDSKLHNLSLSESKRKRTVVQSDFEKRIGTMKKSRVLEGEQKVEGRTKNSLTPESPDMSYQGDSDIFEEDIQENDAGNAINAIASSSRSELRKSLAQDIRSRNIRQDRSASSNGWRKTGERLELDKAVDFVGTCPTMCPAEEMEARVIQRDLSVFEMLDGADYDVDPNLAVKKYRRSAANSEQQLPKDVRPPAVLLKTMEHLKTICDRTDHSFAEVHNFVRDRTRSLRQDFTLQQIGDSSCIHVHEEAVRFHILSEHLLCGTSPEEFSSKQNLEQLDKCLVSLRELYAKRRENDEESSMNEAEMQAYYLLFHLFNARTYVQICKELPRSIFKSKEVQFALKARQALSDNLSNYVRFFKMVQAAPYLVACLMHAQFTNVRLHALKTMSAAYKASSTRPGSMPVGSLCSMLAFENDDEAIEFCEHYGLDVADDDSERLVTLGPLRMDVTPWRSRRSDRIIEEKAKYLQRSQIISGTGKDLYNMSLISFVVPSTRSELIESVPVKPSTVTCEPLSSTVGSFGERPFPTTVPGLVTSNRSAPSLITRPAPSIFASGSHRSTTQLPLFQSPLMPAQKMPIQLTAQPPVPIEPFSVSHDSSAQQKLFDGPKGGMDKKRTQSPTFLIKPVVVPKSVPSASVSDSLAPAPIGSMVATGRGLDVDEKTTEAEVIPQLKSEELVSAKELKERKLIEERLTELASVRKDYALLTNDPRYSVIEVWKSLERLPDAQSDPKAALKAMDTICINIAWTSKRIKELLERLSKIEAAPHPVERAKTNISLRIREGQKEFRAIWNIVWKNKALAYAALYQKDYSDESSVDNWLESRDEKKQPPSQRPSLRIAGKESAGRALKGIIASVSARKGFRANVKQEERMFDEIVSVMRLEDVTRLKVALVRDDTCASLFGTAYKWCKYHLSQPNQNYKDGVLGKYIFMQRNLQNSRFLLTRECGVASSALHLSDAMVFALDLRPDLVDWASIRTKVAQGLSHVHSTLPHGAPPAFAFFVVFWDTESSCPPGSLVESKLDLVNIRSRMLLSGWNIIWLKRDEHSSGEAGLKLVRAFQDVALRRKKLVRGFFENRQVLGIGNLAVRIGNATLMRCAVNEQINSTRNYERIIDAINSSWRSLGTELEKEILCWPAEDEIIHGALRKAATAVRGTLTLPKPPAGNSLGEKEYLAWLSSNLNGQVHAAFRFKKLTMRTDLCSALGSLLAPFVHSALADYFEVEIPLHGKALELLLKVPSPGERERLIGKRLRPEDANNAGLMAKLQTAYKNGHSRNVERPALNDHLSRKKRRLSDPGADAKLARHVSKRSEENRDAVSRELRFSPAPLARRASDPIGGYTENWKENPQMSQETRRALYEAELEHGFMLAKTMEALEAYIARYKQQTPM